MCPVLGTMHLSFILPAALPQDFSALLHPNRRPAACLSVSCQACTPASQQGGRATPAYLSQDQLALSTAIQQQLGIVELLGLQAVMLRLGNACSYMEPTREHLGQLEYVRGELGVGHGIVHCCRAGV